MIIIFKIRIHRRALKFLKKLDPETRDRIFSAIDRLSDPFSLPYEKLRGEKNVYRIRVGEYRVIYLVDKRNKVVFILKIDKRERIYDRI